MGMKLRRQNYGSIGPVLSVMLLAIAFSFAAIVIQLASHVSKGPFVFEGELVLVNLVLLGMGIMIAVLLFLGILKGSMGFAVRVAVSLFVFSAIMAVLIYLKLFLSISGAMPSPTLHAALSIAAYLIGFVGMMAIFDVLPRIYRNLLFAGCCGILGAFIGALMPTLAVVGILVVMSIMDLILTSRGTVRESRKMSEDYEKLIILKMSYSSKDWAIGLGDLVCYSMLVANTFTSFGLLPAIIAIILVTIGAIISLRKAQRSAQVPGLPFAIGLGLIPTIVFMFLPAII
jgi:hypothetical protein